MKKAQGHDATHKLRQNKNIIEICATLTLHFLFQEVYSTEIRILQFYLWTMSCQTAE